MKHVTTKAKSYKEELENVKNVRFRQSPSMRKSGVRSGRFEHSRMPKFKKYILLYDILKRDV